MSSTPSLLRTFSVSVIRTAVCLSGLLNACFGVHTQGARDTKALDVGTSLFYSSPSLVRDASPGSPGMCICDSKVESGRMVECSSSFLGSLQVLLPSSHRSTSHTAFTVPFEARALFSLALVRSSIATPCYRFCRLSQLSCSDEFPEYIPPSRRPSWTII